MTITNHAVAVTAALTVIATGAVPSAAHAARKGSHRPNATVRTGPGPCDVVKANKLGFTRATYNTDRRHSKRTKATTMAIVLKRAGFSRKEIRAGIAIGLAESGNRWGSCQSAVNRNFWPNQRFVKSYDYGTWQINTRAHPWAKRLDLYDVYVNARAARRVYVQAGRTWKPWNAHKKALAKNSQFLAAADRAMAAARV